MDKCHCGRNVHTNEDGFTRRLCEWCSDIRCDVPTEDIIIDCESQTVVGRL
jgi:hypothetical protein